MFQRLLLNNCTGLARINIPANKRTTKAPINAKRIINLGRQTTSPRYIRPKHSPNNKDSKMTSIEFKIALFTESWGDVHMWSATLVSWAMQKPPSLLITGSVVYWLAPKLRDFSWAYELQISGSTTFGHDDTQYLPELRSLGLAKYAYIYFW